MADWVKLDTGIPDSDFVYPWGGISGDGSTLVATATTTNWVEPYPKTDIFISTDHGVTWAKKSPAMKSWCWGDVAISPTGQYIALVASDTATYAASVWTTSDYGDTWTERLGAEYGNSLAMSADGSIIYLAGSDTHGVYKSTDYGVTWSNNIEIPDTQDVACNSDGSIVLVSRRAGAGEGAYLSIDGGTSWSLSLSGVASYVAMNSDGTCMAATGELGLSYSSDTGTTWTRVREDGTYFLPFISSDGATIICSLGQGIAHASYDSGVTWEFDDPNAPSFIGANSAGSFLYGQSAYPGGHYIYEGDIPSASIPKLFMDGFDYYGTDHLALKWGTANNINVLPTAGRFSGGCISPGTNAVLSTIPLNDATHVVLGFALNLVTRAEFTITFDGTGTALTFLANGRVEFSGSPPLSPAGVLPLGSWVYLEIGIAPDSLEMRVNGSSLGWVPPTAWTNGPCSGITINHAASSANLSSYWLIDDVRITFGAVQKWFGNSRVVALGLDGNSTPQGWSPSLEPAWQQLNDFPGDISAAEAGLSSVFTTAGLPSPPSAVHGVQLNVYGQDASPTPLAVATVLRSGTETVGATFAFSDQLSLKREAHLVNPSTNLEFTPAELDSIEIGVTTV